VIAADHARSEQPAAGRVSRDQERPVAPLRRLSNGSSKPQQL
jgi:hypothetical protein